MDNFRNAAKAFITKDGKLLLIKRRLNDVHKPGAWDVPGGRLELGENPYEGLKRECREEVGIEIDIITPFDVHHFTRDDGQKITLIIFLCRALAQNIKLSEEHTEYKWLNLDAPVSESSEWLHESISKIKKLNLGNILE